MLQTLFRLSHDSSIVCGVARHGYCSLLALEPIPAIQYSESGQYIEGQYLATRLTLNPTPRVRKNRKTGNLEERFPGWDRDRVLPRCDAYHRLRTTLTRTRRLHSYPPPSSSPCSHSTYTMDVSFAITGKGYVILAADTTAAHSIIKVKLDEDKIKELSPHLCMAYSGEPGMRISPAFPSFVLMLTLLTGDTVQFAEYIERNIRLYQIRNLYPLRPSSAASWIRRSLADSLRSRKPYSVNLLLGGYDTNTHTPHLYWMDYLGTLSEVPFAAHGYGSYFALSLLDR